MTAVYDPRPVKRRIRSTNAELDVIDAAIIDAVEEDKPVSLRGVYYRVVSAGAVEKTDAGYQQVKRELLKLRRDGRVSYADITDGTRWIWKPHTWDSVESALEDAAASYRRALWHDSWTSVMVFVEKDAISGIVLPVTTQWDVPLGVLRGYASESFAWSVAQSVLASNTEEVHVYQLGDHDPSGVDAWRDFTSKVHNFVDDERPNTSPFVHFERLAVTPEQIWTMGLPTRPTKTKDTRARKFAGESVEVDAIRAPDLRNIVTNAITQHIDPDALRITRVAEQSEREVFTRLIGEVTSS